MARGGFYQVRRSQARNAANHNGRRRDDPEEIRGLWSAEPVGTLPAAPSATAGLLAKPSMTRARARSYRSRFLIGTKRSLCGVGCCWWWFEGGHDR
jgi:hypothetical protein